MKINPILSNKKNDIIAFAGLQRLEENKERVL